MAAVGQRSIGVGFLVSRLSRIGLLKLKDSAEHGLE